MSVRAPAVAEIQGLYGPFSFAEKLLQKIWLRGDFDVTLATTTDGRRVHVGHRGKWNLLGGPDFRGARIRLGDGPELTGDIELHLRAADWVAHRHASDRAYDGVVLHVVLFPPEVGHVTRGAGGQEIPVVALLPWLHHDLEEFAAEEAVEALAGRSAARIPDELAALGEAELADLIASRATKRWCQKVHYARLRVARLGWAGACHHAALEILGYRFNRAPMLHVAARWALQDWAEGRAVPDEIYAEQQGAWSLQGVRPANHPRTRLRQYAAWTQGCPAWPARLEGWAAQLTAGGPLAMGTREVRRTNHFTALRARVAGEICAGAIGGTRLDTLVCDGFWPLLAAATGRDDARWQGMWQHWFTGDFPPFVLRGLRELDVFQGAARPACHGAAQGLLGWLLEREARG
jgi:hypothetical protein